MPKLPSLPNQSHVVRYGTAEIATKNAATKLKEILNLSNNAAEFEKLRNDFRLLGKEFLNSDEPASTQRNAAESIKEALVEKYPDLYPDDSREEKLTLTVQLIYEEHNRERAKRQRNAPIPNFGKRQSASAPERAASVVSLTSSEPEQSPRQDDDDNNDNNKENRPGSSVLPYARYLNKSRPPLSVNSTSASSSSSGSQSNPFASSSGTLSSSSSANTSISSDNNFLTDFLDSCIPAMTHLMDKFLDFGCNCEEHLRIISTWNTDQIIFFLRRVSTHTPGDPITQMDIRILEEHVSTYFG